MPPRGLKTNKLPLPYGILDNASRTFCPRESPNKRMWLGVADNLELSIRGEIVVALGRLPRDGATLRRMALAYPEAYEDMPWGHHAIKVKGKAFVFLAADEATFYSGRSQ